MTIHVWMTETLCKTIDKLQETRKKISYDLTVQINLHDRRFYCLINLKTNISMFFSKFCMAP